MTIVVCMTRVLVATVVAEERVPLKYAYIFEIRDRAPIARGFPPDRERKLKPSRPRMITRSTMSESTNMNVLQSLVPYEHVISSTKLNISLTNIIPKITEPYTLVTDTLSTPGIKDQSETEL